MKRKNASTRIASTARLTGEVSFVSGGDMVVKETDNRGFVHGKFAIKWRMGDGVVDDFRLNSMGSRARVVFR